MRYHEIVQNRPAQFRSEELPTPADALSEAGIIKPQTAKAADNYNKLAAKRAKLQARIRDAENAAGRKTSGLRNQLATTR